MTLRRFIMTSLKRGLVLSVSVPLAIAIICSVFLFKGQWTNHQNAQQIHSLKQYVETLGLLVHEQQKERGATSVFLSSKGTQLRSELEAQRKLTDAATAAFLQVYTTTPINRQDRLSEKLANIAQVLGKRASLRAAIDNFGLPTSEALSAYTSSNASMLGAIGFIGATSKDPDIAKHLGAIEALMTAKEFSGIERAVGSGGYAVGAFDLNRVRMMERVAARQTGGFARFEALATDTYRQDMAEINALPETRELRRMRDIALDFYETEDLQGITAKSFFSAATVRIDAMKVLEDQMVADVTEIAANQLREAWVSMALLGFGIVAALGTSMIMTRFVNQSMLSSVRAISDAGDQLARGNDDAKLPTENPQELGRIVWSINSFRESVIEAKAREAQLADDRAKTEQAAREESERVQRMEKERAENEASQAREEQMRMKDYVAKLSEVVNACAKGDFSRRLPKDDAEGALADVSDGLNRISESVESSLHEIRAALGHMAAGDMTYEMHGQFEGVFAEISAAATEATRNMAETLKRVSQSSEHVSVSSSQISGTTQELARRSESNMGMLKQTTNAIEEMSALIKTATTASQTARENIVRVSEKAEADSHVAGQSIEAMEAIQSSSVGIVKILSVIDDIAFQTNLLALNAGVEAARAGEAGRGFAVVATEVRALAQRSSEAGREISELLAASEENVQRGVEMVDQTAQSLNAVVAQIQDVSGQIEDITSSFETTYKKIEDVSTATTDLDRSTRENVAKIEDAHQAVQHLDTEVKHLNESVQSFNIDKTQDAENKTSTAA